LIASLSTNFEVANRQVHAIAGALKENKGLVELDFCTVLWVSDEAWVAIFYSLKTHPTLKAFGLQTTRINDARFSLASIKIKLGYRLS
jgi:hypothetical protein